jgi:hypothetical protein
MPEMGCGRLIDLGSAKAMGSVVAMPESPKSPNR